METIYRYELFSFYNVASQFAFLAFILSCSFFIALFKKHKMVVILLALFMAALIAFHINSNIYENYYIYEQIKNNKTKKLYGRISAIEYDKSQTLLLTVDNKMVKIRKDQFNCYHSINFMVSDHKYEIGDLLNIEYVELDDHICTTEIKLKKSNKSFKSGTPQSGAP